MTSGSATGRPSFAEERPVAKAKTGGMVAVIYKGTPANGEVFDASAEGGPFAFAIGRGQVIPGVEKVAVGSRTYRAGGME